MIKLRVRYGRETVALSFPDDASLADLQRELCSRTGVRAPHQRLIGPKGLLVRGKLFLGDTTTTTSTAAATAPAASTGGGAQLAPTPMPNNGGDDDDGTDNRGALSEYGISDGMQLLLVGARAVPPAAASSASSPSPRNSGAIITAPLKPDEEPGPTAVVDERQQYADLARLLVVPQPCVESPETTLLKCSYSKGYVNQEVYVCATCIEAGVADPAHAICASCAAVCHEGHELQCWGLRRATRCDCCTSRCIPTPAKRTELVEKHGLLTEAAKALRRCMFIADEATHVAPSLPLPENTDNIYPPFPGHWCPCEWQEDDEEDQQQRQHDSAVVVDVETAWGARNNIPCIYCGQVYWAKHLSNLRCDALACQPCQGVQTGNASAFYCRTCAGFSCVACRLHCHRGHDVDTTPYWFSPGVGGFVDPLRAPRGDDDDDNQQDSDGDGFLPMRVFPCCCGGKCNIVGQVAAPAFIEGACEARKIGSAKPSRTSNHDRAGDAASLLPPLDQKLLHPSSRDSVTVPNTSYHSSTTVGSLLLDDFALYVCEPCSRHNAKEPLGLLQFLFPGGSNNSANGQLTTTMPSVPCFAVSALLRKNANNSGSTTETEQQEPSLLKQAKSCLATSQEQAEFAACATTAPSRPHGSLLPLIFFEWSRGNLTCRCVECGLRTELMLPGARQLDMGPMELAMTVGGHCSNCGELLEAGGTYLCVSCEHDAAARHGSNTTATAAAGGAGAGGGPSNTGSDPVIDTQNSYELCNSCYQIRESIHPPDHDFELQTLGNALRQVFALVDAEGDASTRLWLREQLHETTDPIALLETIVSMLTGRVRLEESERSLRESLSMRTSHEAYEDESSSEQENNDDDIAFNADLDENDDGQQRVNGLLGDEQHVVQASGAVGVGGDDDDTQGRRRRQRTASDEGPAVPPARNSVDGLDEEDEEPVELTEL